MSEAGPRWRVRVRRVEGAPVVAVRVALRGGARQESIPGQALLTGRALAEGTSRRDWRRLADEAEARGMVLASTGAAEGHGVALDALAADWRQALDWTAEIALEPSFPEERCAWLARQASAELESLGDQPEVRTAWGFLAQLYGAHPLGRPLHGDAASLARLGAADLAAFHRRSLAAGGVVAVAGAIDEEAVAARLADLFDPAAEVAEPWPVPAPPSSRAGEGHAPRGLVALPAAEQAHLYAGHLTVPIAHPDLAALEVAGIVLGSGAGLSGRIPKRVREREGLAYSAQAQAVAGAGLDPGRLVAYAGTAPATAERAEAAIREEIACLVEEGVTGEELEEARAYLLGSEPFRRETARQWAEILGESELYGLPLDDPTWREQRLLRLDRQAVEAACRRHVKPEALQVTVGMPA